MVPREPGYQNSDSQNGVQQFLSRVSVPLNMEEFRVPEVTVARSVEGPGIAEVTANVLEAEKRALAESQVKLQADFEVREAKFNADLEALTANKSQAPKRSEPTVSWLLARKCWAWLHRE